MGAEGKRRRRARWGRVHAIKPQTFLVRCSGHEHRLELTDKGTLRVTDHEKGLKTSDSVMNELGLKNRCYELLKHWNKYFVEQRAWTKVMKDRWLSREARMPPLMLAAAQDIAKVHLHNRWHRKAGNWASPKGSSIVERTADLEFVPNPQNTTGARGYSCRKRIELAAQSVLADRFRAAKFKQPDYWRFSLSMSSNFDREPSVSISRTRYRRGWRGIRRICLDVYIRLPYRWWYKVYKQGLSVIGRYFILDIQKPADGGRPIYVALRQSRGYGLKVQKMRMRGSKLVRVLGKRKVEVKNAEEHPQPSV